MEEARWTTVTPPLLDVVLVVVLRDELIAVMYKTLHSDVAFALFNCLH